MRKGKERYRCLDCSHWFQINRSKTKIIDQKKLLFDYLSGLSFRTLSEKEKLSPASIYLQIKTVLKQLPRCADITRIYCSHFCGILLVDGKYLYVKKYSKKIPVIYGLDYLTHDIPNFIVSRGENYQTLLSFFNSLKLSGYPLKSLVCDDNQNIQLACKQVYSKAIIQICHNHYKENIRRTLGVRSDSTYLNFMSEIEFLFKKRRTKDEFVSIARRIFIKYKSDPKCLNILLDIERRSDVLLAYVNDSCIPRTTNLIECFNSHLEGRLKTIKGFQSMFYARDWLNAYFIKRRLKPFTDCGHKFQKLNGRCSLQMTIKDDEKFKTLKEKIGL